MTPDRLPSRMGWWTISGEALMSLLCRANQGEDPELLYTEEYANAEVHSYWESDD